jgi:HlyD family secretion protein
VARPRPRLEEVFRASGGRVPSGSELDSARAASARAAAAEASARANAAEAEAALRANETNLRKSSIRSPIEGVVLARSVEPGQAVAASLQAVTLLTLAEDLRQMKLQVNVDEADVGQVAPGQKATFTVSAYPTRRYPATISRVGFGPTTKDNVVTYLAELAVDNGDQSLRPGMTATASIVTVQRQDALLVPNAALRFNPDAAANAAAAAAAGGSGGIAARLLPRMPRSGAPRSAGTDTSQVRQVWVLQDGKPQALPVTPGASDGRHTEVTSERLREGMQVIVGQRAAAS